MRNMLVTGAAGFIGTNFVRYCKENHPDDNIVVVDALTYAGNPHNLKELLDDRCQFVKADINDTDLMMSLLRDRKINTIVHFAAESHVDRSITGPDAFIEANILGTFFIMSLPMKCTGHYLCRTLHSLRKLHMRLILRTPRARLRQIFWFVRTIIRSA